MNQRGLFWSCVLLVGAVAFGCGDDDDGEPTAGTGGSAGATGGVGGAAGGSAGSGGSGGTAGMTAVPVMCGTMTCQAPASPFAMFAALAPGLLPPPPVACCMTATTTCGLAPMTNAMCEARAMPDPRCAGVGLSIPGMMGGAPVAAGCCNAMSRCGVDGSAFGRGCVENAEAATMLGQLAGFLSVPAPKACDDPLPMAGTGGTGGGGAGGDDDAGMP